MVSEKSGFNKHFRYLTQDPSLGKLLLITTNKHIVTMCLKRNESDNRLASRNRFDIWTVSGLEF